MMNVYKSIMDRIGNTPLVEISKLNPNKKVTILAKLESANPGGSIKDRTALSMIENAEKRGDLKPGRIILEATSGNTGIGLAMVAAAKGYKLCLTMSEAASEERKKILRAMGAELIFTPAAQGTDGAIEVAYRMLRENPEKYFGTDQFNNPDNVRAHYFGTAQEIWDQTQGRIAAVVVTLGTTGTAMGISQRLKELDCRIQIIGVEPYLQHKIQGLKNMRESYRPGIYDKKRLDEKVNILDEDAFEMSRRLAREEGILAGMSSGAAMFVAAQKARQMEEGTIVVIFPDSGERYLSTELFAVKEELATVSFYNAIKRRKTLFRPLNPKEVRLRTCGPTVHDAPHLGNYRRLVVSDLLCRYLTFKGYAVKHVVDIVDCSDKSLKGSEKAGMNLADYSDKYLRIFLEDVRFLQIRPDNIYVRASEDVDAALKIVEKLVDRGYAYEKLHSVYFDISKLGDYGSLSNIDPAKTRTGRSVDLDDYEKDSPADFALLKRAGLGELKRGIYSKTKWGNVRPGWHLECAAISRKYLGAAYDIHVSGADETFPHCENLIAINKACCGHSGAKYWIGAELILVDGRKMSRSLNNIVTMDDLRQSGHGGRDVRFFLLGMNYRKPISYSVSALQMARNTIKKMDTFISRLQTIRNAAPNFPEVDQLIYDLNHAFERALDDDLNISGALAALFEFIGAVNAPLAGEKISGEDARKILEALQKINDVLQVMDFKKPIDDRQIDELIQKREKARQAGLWQEADLLRNRLAGLGVDVLDSRQGTIWRFK
ncbi:MAG TPA: cysteine--tRNA ligase [Smithellaceae bacterium]|nr:cysteine--tRNA ligase [Smithellaceae bacterium]HNY95246.1 cysteine--tRNA ligase [Smithellaceae bacterium]HPB15031.1 cysteine--tRNA ligase [Smithellaceae bacterium]HPV73079.1 cysteine--tRNA ligase [Smithellaceae bacterium]HPY07670.1 cysteine--tRNA ligase [Smithellaceae bacterium]